MNPWKSFVGGIALLALLAPLALAAQYKDHDLGFQITVPEKWKKVPVSAQEQWIVAKYLSPREYESKNLEAYDRHTPELRVIVFPSSVTKDRGVEAKETEKGSIVLMKKNPYKDYKSYLKENAQGGYFISKEEERVINGIKTTCLEIKFEKLTTPRRQLAWIFHGPDADWVVTLEAMEDYIAKMIPDFEKCLRSFKLFERKGTLKKDGVTTGDSGVIDLSDIQKKSPEERAKKRQELFEKELKTALDRLPGDWVQKKSKNFVALAHTDEKFAQKMLDQAEALRAWLDQNLAFLGEGKPGPVILRICQDWDEYKSYAMGSDDSWRVSSAEAATFKQIDDGMRSASVQYLNWRVVRIWLFDRNPRLSWGMPGWLSAGLDRVLITATSKNGKLDFRPDEWEMELMRSADKKGKIASPRELVRSTWEEFSRTPNAAAQAGRFVRFLMTGPKTGVTKDVLRLYFTNLLEVIAEEDKKDAEAKGPEDKPKTEEEEEALFKQRKQREKKRLQEVFDRTFGTWTEADWNSLEKIYFDWAT